MKYIFPIKEPDKAYISNSLWLPKKFVPKKTLQMALEFTVASGIDGISTIKMWKESPHHIICPREFLPPSKYTNFEFPFIDLRPQFQKVQFKDLVIPRNEEQWKAWEALKANNNGILNLACGKGKTKLAQKKIAQLGVPTLVIVPDGGMLDQWKRSIYGDENTLPGLEYFGELGIVQGPVFKKAPLTLALVSTLSLKIKKNLVSEDFFRYFGLIIYDEVHQVGAPVFSLTASPFYGDRIGLTATVNREDGLDPIYKYHIGEPFYTDLDQDLIPKIYFQQTPVNLNQNLAQVNDMTNIPMLRTMLGNDLTGNIHRYYSIKQAIDSGRKVLCLSHSKAQLKLMHAMFPNSGLIIQTTKREDRLDVLRNTNPCFAIAKLGSVGIDDDRLDTLFWLTPFRSKISLQQSMGRIQRYRPNKKEPIVVVFEDWMTKSLKSLCLAIKRSLKEWDFKFETLKPQKVLKSLPTEVQKAYDHCYSELIAGDDGSEENSAESID
jgi:superfamily II DNA or RNA helicase